jgi:RNA polymerase sigma-70 factor (ECF subfamily)
LSWALEKLPDNQRIAFTLSKYKELSYEEISSVMNVSIPSVESLIHRAKTSLRKSLTKYYEKHL